MRVLITGAGGRLGRALVDAFADHDLATRTHAELDISREPDVAAAVSEVRPAVVVNAAAMTDVDACESAPTRAHVVNALGPWWLARACRRLGTVLVHVSTDYVFGAHVGRGPDGHPRPFTEFDVPAPVNTYGRTKAAGDQLVRDSLPEHHIVRTSWVAGAGEAGFLPAVVRAARHGQPLKVVDDQVSCPTAAADLAAAIREVAVSGRFGTVHRTNAGPCSRHALAVAALEHLGLDVEVEAVASSTLRRPVLRPAFSVLDATHAEASGLRPMDAWRDALPRMLGPR